MKYGVSNRYFSRSAIESVALTITLKFKLRVGNFVGKDPLGEIAEGEATQCARLPPSFGTAN